LKNKLNVIYICNNFAPALSTNTIQGFDGWLTEDLSKKILFENGIFTDIQIVYDSEIKINVKV